MIAPSGKASPLRGRYLVQDPVSNAALRLVDRVLDAVARSPAPSVTRPRRVLIANGGHLGDAVIATAILPVLRAELPGVEIGMVVGSWARAVIEGHPLVSRVHTVDHWHTSRAPLGRVGKLRRYARSRRQALAEIRDAGYDAAIDLYPFFPNTALLARQAGIPVRVGYTSGGFGALYTHPVPWRESGRHTVEYQLDLLREMGLTASSAARPELPPVPQAVAREVDGELERARVERGRYVVVHTGSGSALKEWPVDRWRSVAERLAAEGLRVVLTGSGEEECRRAAELSAGIPGAVDLSGRLSWAGFVHVIGGARLLVSLDSVAGHVAAAFDTPSVVLMAGMSDMRHWRPLSTKALVVTNPVPCAPCFRSAGCETMACIRDVSTSVVIDLIHRQLSGSGSGAARPAPSIADSGAK